jgi:hypothetical protein
MELRWLVKSECCKKCTYTDSKMNIVLYCCHYYHNKRVGKAQPADIMRPSSGPRGLHVKISYSNNIKLEKSN